MEAERDTEQGFLDDLDAAKWALQQLMFLETHGVLRDEFRAQVNRAVDALAVNIDTWDNQHRTRPKDDLT